MQRFRRKIFSLKTYLTSQKEILKNLPSLLSAKRAGRISRAFEEKIMLAVTAVNGCKYCSWYHVRAALRHGVEQKEIERILNMDLGTTADDHETTGILYAQHYAESNGKPDREATDKLFEVYGKERAEDILLHLQLIYFGNLMGNTFYAFSSRLKGNGAQDSNFLAELLIFLIGFPLFAPLSLMARRKDAGG